MKLCQKCQVSRPLTDFHKHKRAKDGLRNECKFCRTSGKNRKVKELASQGLKYCGKCDETKPLTDFFTNKGKPHTYCKACDKHYEQTSQVRRGNQTTYRHSDRYKEVTANYRARNPEKVKANTQKQNAIRYTDPVNLEKQRRYARKAFKKNRKQSDARTLVHLHVRFGLLPKASELPCKYCDSQAKHYHHPDYDQPLLIEPVCIQCHAKIHDWGDNFTKAMSS